MLVRLVHPAKAESPMLVTLFRIVMFVMLMQSPKASLPMLLTLFPSIVSGMVKARNKFLSHPVIWIALPLISYFKFK